MKPGRSYDCVVIEQAVDLLVGVLRKACPVPLQSVILYGSVVFDDLAPGYGDLDFLAVAARPFDEKDAKAIVGARAELRSGLHGIYAEMLEGAILPPAMLDPGVAGLGVWWGTTREVTWDRNKLGPLVLHVVRECGLVVRGKDVRNLIPQPGRQEMLDDVRQACRTMFEHGIGGSVHSVDWLLTAARLLLWLREGRLSSKSEAADWGIVNCEGEWRRELAQAKATRLNPYETDRAWLASLDGPIREAACELDGVLAGSPPA